MAFDENPNSVCLHRGETLKIIETFECVDAFINDQDAYDNALASLQNSSNFSKLGGDISLIEDSEIQGDKDQLLITNGSLKDNLMQHLTNLRFRFNDGQFIKHMAYPEVKVNGEGTHVQIFNRRFQS